MSKFTRALSLLLLLSITQASVCMPSKRDKGKRSRQVGVEEIREALNPERTASDGEAQEPARSYADVARRDSAPASSSSLAIRLPAPPDIMLTNADWHEERFIGPLLPDGSKEATKASYVAQGAIGTKDDTTKKAAPAKDERLPQADEKFWSTQVARWKLSYRTKTRIAESFFAYSEEDFNIHYSKNRGHIAHFVQDGIEEQVALIMEQRKKAKFDCTTIKSIDDLYRVIGLQQAYLYAARPFVKDMRMLVDGSATHGIEVGEAGLKKVYGTLNLIMEDDTQLAALQEDLARKSTADLRSLREKTFDMSREQSALEEKGYMSDGGQYHEGKTTVKAIRVKINAARRALREAANAATDSAPTS